MYDATTHVGCAGCMARIPSAAPKRSAVPPRTRSPRQNTAIATGSARRPSRVRQPDRGRLGRPRHGSSDVVWVHWLSSQELQLRQKYAS
jgi:hypothetical protein